MAKLNYPHLTEIKDVPTQRSLRLAWDQLRNHDDIVTALQAQLTALKASVASNAQATSSLAGVIATQNIVAARAVATGSGGGGSGDGGGGGTDDGGQGAAGCTAAGADGHVPGGTALTLTTVGMIVCGVPNEFPTLVAPAVDQPTRDANVLELLGRTIWHLQLAGFTAGKQQNPSLAISTDKITVQIGTVWWAYDIFSLGIFSDPLTVHMVPVGSPMYVADPGIAD